jgi:predicted nucleic acid-binding protein
VEWLTSLKGSAVGLDTAPLIYFIERHATYLPILRPFFAAAEKQEFQLVTSLVTLIEVLIQPLRAGRHELVREYRNILFGSPNLKTLPLTLEVAEEAARLRAAHNLRTPDAIHVATAKAAGASWFLTNDVDLLSVPGLSVLVLDKLRDQ